MTNSCIAAYFEPAAPRSEWYGVPEEEGPVRAREGTWFPRKGNT